MLKLLLFSGLAFLLLTNLITLFYLVRRKRAPVKKLDVSANMLLEELLRGQAVVVTNVLNPEDLLLWSPKDR